MTTVQRTGERSAGFRLAATLGLIAIMTATSAILIWGVPGSAPGGAPFELGLLAMGLIALAGELASTGFPIGRQAHTVSLSEVALVVGLAFADPLTLVAARVTAGLVALGVVRRLALPKLAFNVALFALETAVAATVFHALAVDQIVGVRTSAALALAAMSASAVGLLAVRAVLRLHGARPREGVVWFSAATSVVAICVGLLAVAALAWDTIALVPVAGVFLFAYLGMRAGARAVPVAGTS